MPPLSRIHSILGKNVTMHDGAVKQIVAQLEALLDNGLAGAPQLHACVLRDGWLPIASVLNYSPLGQTVWPYGGVGVVGDCLMARPSKSIELSGDGACVRAKPLRVLVRDALERLFSDANYHRDVHLQLLAEQDGYTPLDALVRTYEPVRALLAPAPAQGLTPAQLLDEAVSSSSELVRSSAGGSVRRKSLAERIIAQAEYYLGSERMAADSFLMEQASVYDGWVPIATVLSFPRMRKLCHPQVGAVAHVLSGSARLEVSQDKRLVRPSLTPPASPARASAPSGLRDRLLAAVGALLSDASLTLDRAIQAAIAAASPPAAIERGGVGCRVAFDALLAHPLLAPLAAEHQKSKLSALLPRDDKNDKGFYLESDGSHVVRLRPTPEVRQLRAAVDADAPAAEGDFSVFQFNILADMLATLEQFPTVDTTHLDWSRRRDLVLQEVGYHLPDIITLQEVQSTGGDGSANDHLAEIEGVLRTAHGYSTRYVRKVRWHGHGWPPGVAQIGNVISWRDEAFEFIAHKEVHIAPQLCALCDDEPSKMHFGRGAQVGLLVALRHRKLGRVVVVVTTHLTSNFMEPVCQIAQAEVVMLAAAEFAKEHGPNAAVVLGADLNSIPGSGVYSLLTAGRRRPPAFTHHRGERRAPELWRRPRRRRRCALPAAPSVIGVCDGARARASLHQLHGPALALCGDARLFDVQRRAARHARAAVAV